MSGRDKATNIRPETAQAIVGPAAMSAPFAASGQEGRDRSSTAPPPLHSRRLGQLPAFRAAFAGDRLDHPLRAFKSKDRLLQLGVDHRPIRNHQHRVEDFLVIRIMQLREKMRGPGDGVRLARSRRVLDEILAARPVAEHRALDSHKLR